VVVAPNAQLFASSNLTGVLSVLIAILNVPVDASLNPTLSYRKDRSGSGCFPDPQPGSKRAANVGDWLGQPSENRITPGGKPHE
jgi:hypothetical protein